MNNKVDVQNFLDKVKKVTAQKELDLSSSEDLSIGIMNIISIEEHLFYTSQKTKDKKYLDLINEIRSMRTELMKEIIKDFEGEVWCISKHLLAASMRLMEVGNKELKVGDPDHSRRAWSLFDKSYKLYSLFWGLNLGVVGTKDLSADKASVKQNGESNIKYINEKGIEKENPSVFSKLGLLLQKAVDCCKE